MAKKTKVTTWITGDALRGLRELAAAHQLTVSRVAADILERGLKERAETAGFSLLGPAVEGVVKREVFVVTAGSPIKPKRVNAPERCCYRRECRREAEQQRDQKRYPREQARRNTARQTRRRRVRAEPKAQTTKTS